jgi:hypothetical protein
VSSLAGLFDFAAFIIRRLKPPVNKVTPLTGLSEFPTIISTLFQNIAYFYETATIIVSSTFL